MEWIQLGNFSRDENFKQIYDIVLNLPYGSGGDQISSKGIFLIFALTIVALLLLFGIC